MTEKSRTRAERLRTLLTEQFHQHLQRSDDFDDIAVGCREEEVRKTVERLRYEYRCRAAQDLLAILRTADDRTDGLRGHPGRKHAARAFKTAPKGLVGNDTLNDLLDIGWWLEEGGDPMLRHEYRGARFGWGAWIRLRKLAKDWSRRQHYLTKD